MRGQNVSYTVRVPFLDAAKGARRRVQLYDGKALDVTIPAGTTDGQTLRLKGQGMPGMGGGPAGDALIEVRVDGHPHFERDGRSEEHTSELQSLMRISYAVFCLQKKNRT